MKQFRFFTLLAIVAGTFLLSGCASTEPENVSERPWNAPKSWEHGMPSGMMPRY